MHSDTQAPDRRGARYVGIDLARLLAVIGMMANHLVAIASSMPGATDADVRAAEVATTLTSGIAAVLFAVLGGVSAVFATKRSLARGRKGQAAASLIIRGAILIVLGLALGELKTPIIVVLTYYGAAMIIASLFIAASTRVIAIVAAALWLAGGTVNALTRQALDLVEEGGSPTFESISAFPVETVRGLLLTGSYPAITWLAYMLVGVLIARGLVAASARGKLTRLALGLAAVGAACATVATLVSTWTLHNLALFGVDAPEGLTMKQYRGHLTLQQFGVPESPEPWAQLIAAPHSGSPVEMLRTVGIALVVIGLLVAIFDSRGKPANGFVDIFRAAGAAPLTIYTLHIVATSFTFAPLFAGADYSAGIPWWVAGVSALVLQLAGVLVLGIVLSATGRRGPLEALTSGIVRTVTRT